VIRGELTNLRAVERNHAPDLYDLLNDEETLIGWGMAGDVRSRARIEADIEGWLDEERRQGRPSALVIETLDGRFAGLILLRLALPNQRHVEVSLAVAPWVARLRRPGTALAVAFHSATLMLVTNDPLVGLRLVVFGGTAVLLHAASASLLKSDAAPTEGVSPRRGGSRASS